jgi:NAD(P)-dependent dehydrogenase (short-subunit alcohol dehydrogenase family)
MTKMLVITGGSKGLGWAIAEKYLQNGWCVLSGSRSKRPNIAVEFQDRFRQFEMDVRDREDAQAQVDDPPLYQFSKPHELTPLFPFPRPLCIVF